MRLDSAENLVPLEASFLYEADRRRSTFDRLRELVKALRDLLICTLTTRAPEDFFAPPLFLAAGAAFFAAGLAFFGIFERLRRCLRGTRPTEVGAR